MQKRQVSLIQQDPKVSHTSTSYAITPGQTELLNMKSVGGIGKSIRKPSRISQTASGNRYHGRDGLAFSSSPDQHEFAIWTMEKGNVARMTTRLHSVQRLGKGITVMLHDSSENAEAWISSTLNDNGIEFGKINPIGGKMFEVNLDVSSDELEEKLESLGWDDLRT